MEFLLNREHLFPHLVAGPLDPAWEGVPVGHGLFVLIFEDDAHAEVTPEQLRDANLTAVEAHRLALDNLIRFADESPALTIQVLGKPGDAVHFLLYSDHPRASSCLLLPDLYEHTSELLQASELLACVPQRESLVIFPKRDRAYREMLVGKLREIEADAAHPLGFPLFELAPGSVRPFAEEA